MEQDQNSDATLACFTANTARTNSEAAFILRQFINAHIQEEETISVYLTRLKELSKKLKNSIGHISDFHLAVKMISSLPEQYESVVSHLKRLPDEQLTAENVENALLQEEERIKSSGSSFQTRSIFLEFSHARMQEEETIPVYLTRLKDLYKKLKNTKAVVDDYQFAVKMIGSLPDRYKSIVSHLEQLPDEQLTAENVEKALLQEEERIKSSGSGTASSSGLNTAKD